MKKILFITDTYYPDSGATTTIVKRTAEELAKLGYVVDVYPSEISGIHFSYGEKCNGVKIIKPNLEERKNATNVFDSIVNSLSRVFDANGYDCVFSAAVNFKVNFLAHQVVKERNCAWFPMSYDPYAFDPHITNEQKAEYINQEIIALKDASKIFFLNEFKEDYVGSPIEDKIVYFNLPCIRKIDPDRSKRVIEFDKSYINCVFLGDFYYGVENTDFIFRLFQELDDKVIRFYTIGNLGDYKDTVDLWQEKLGDKYIRHERISQEEAHNAMLDCDLLVSMGHDSPNMCPSKAIDFVSSGKPILHISKIENCCAKKYLEKYSNKFFVYQNEKLTDELIENVQNFVLKSKKSEQIPFSKIKDIYSDFTMEVLIKKIIKEF